MTTNTDATSGSVDASQESAYSSPRHARYVLAVLTLVYIFSFLDRQILNLLVAPPDQRPASEWLAARLAVTSQLHAEGMLTGAVRALERAEHDRRASRVCQRRGASRWRIHDPGLGA